MSGPILDTVVIGAGMAGLTSARALAAAGLDVAVVDKARVVGGRMATRRFAGGRFDHGAQHFSARSPEFRDAVAGWRRDEIVDVWFESASLTRPERGVEQRHIGRGAMRAVPEHLADGLTVHTECRVERLDSDGAHVSVVAAGCHVVARSVVVTPPLPQALTLLDASGLAVPREMAASLRAVRYDATLAVLATVARVPELPEGHQSHTHGPIAWIADNQQKGVSAIPAVTIHSSPDFAAQYLEANPDEWTEVLIAAAEELMGVAVVAAHGHRWRYAQPRTTFDSGAVALESPVPVVLAGEAFAGAKVEGAFRSGLAAAGAVLDRLS